MYPKCNKCDSDKRTIYQVGIVKVATPVEIDFFRCYCAFCDGCIADVKKRNPDKIYVPLDGNGRMPSPSEFYTLSLDMYYNIARLTNGVMNSFRSELLDMLIKSFEPIHVKYVEWLVETYYKV